MSAMTNSTVPIRPSIVISLCASMSLGTLAMTAPASAYATGADMMKMCRPFIDYVVGGREPNNPYASPLDGMPCMMYIGGASEALTLLDSFWVRVCVPENVTGYTRVLTVLDYVKGHPEKLDEGAIFLIMSALATAYPCRTGEHRPHAQSPSR
jgi:hypothetical protein